MKHITFNKKYNRFRTGFYIAFNNDGHIYDYNKIVKKGLSIPKLIKKENHPTLLHKFNINNVSERQLIIDDIKKHCRTKHDFKNILFVGSSDGEYDSAIIGWSKVYREKKFCPVIVYSLATLLDILHQELKDDGLAWEDAYEHWSYNINGSWLGVHTPIYQYHEDEI